MFAESVGEDLPLASASILSHTLSFIFELLDQIYCLTEWMRPWCQQWYTAKTTEVIDREEHFEAVKIKQNRLIRTYECIILPKNGLSYRFSGSNHRKWEYCQPVSDHAKRCAEIFEWKPLRNNRCAGFVEKRWLGLRRTQPRTQMSSDESLGVFAWRPPRNSSRWQNLGQNIK